MDIKKIDQIVANATVEDLVSMANIACAAKAGLIKVEGDQAGTYSKWAVVPEKAPDWLWKLSRSADDWSLGFVSECLGLISSEVRVTPSGKPFTNLMYYSNAGFRDNEVLIKWSNSSPDRMELVKNAIDAGETLIGSARVGYESERLSVFSTVFENVYKQFQNGDIPAEPEVPKINVDDTPVEPEEYNEYED
jgi:hypothetical protein